MSIDVSNSKSRSLNVVRVEMVVYLDVLLERGAHSFRLITIQERHLETVVLIEEAIHGRKHYSHAELIRVDEIQSLGHAAQDHDACSGSASTPSSHTQDLHFMRCT
jgi:hypothetical protein